MPHLAMKCLRGIKIHKPVTMLVCDMAGTTINEGGIVYQSLFKVISKHADVTQDDISKWQGRDKYEVLDSYIQNNREESHKEFNKLLEEEYFTSNKISLIDKDLPDLFNELREGGIKVCLNTGYNRDIQESIIEKLKMKNCIDDYISSSEVDAGRPEPFMIHALMKRNNIKNSKRVVKIGDTLNDVQEGINANCGESIGVLTGACKEEDFSTRHLMKTVMDLGVSNSWEEAKNSEK